MHFYKIDYNLHAFLPIARLSLHSSSFSKAEWQFYITWKHHKPQKSFIRYRMRPPQNLHIKPQSRMGPYLPCPGVRHLFVQADVQIIARLVGQEEPNRNRLPRRRQPNVDLQLGLEDAELPEAAPVAHHHAPHGLLDLKHTTRTSLTFQAHPALVTSICCCQVLPKGAPRGTSQQRWKHQQQHVSCVVTGPRWPVCSPNKPWTQPGERWAGGTALDSRSLFLPAQHTGPRASPPPPSSLQA